MPLEYHPDRFSSALLNLGVVAFHQEDFATAESALARARVIRVKVYGARSSGVAKVDRAVGELRQREGRLVESRHAYERALWGFGTATRDDSVQTATTLIKYTDCLQELKDRKAEHDALVGALGIRQALLPPEDPDIAEVKDRLAARGG